MIPEDSKLLTIGIMVRPRRITKMPVAKDFLRAYKTIASLAKNDAPRSRALDTIALAEGFAIVPSDSHPTPNPS